MALNEFNSSKLESLISIELNFYLFEGLSSMLSNCVLSTSCGLSRISNLFI
jgi:hypothetical protein